MLTGRRFPFWDFDDVFTNMNRMMDLLEGPLSVRSMPRGTFPAMNLYDEGEKYVVTAEVPGVQPEDLNLEVVENTLTLAGTRNGDAKDAKYYRRERPHGSFSRTVTLGERVEPDQVTADYKHGVLIVTLPKTQKAQSRKIEVNAG